MPKNVTLPYNGLALDRAGGRRADQAWVDATLARPDSRVFAFWRDTCLVADGVPVSVRGLGEAVFLGVDGDAGVFATDLSNRSDLSGRSGLSDVDEVEALLLAGADAAVDVRTLFPGLDPQEAATLAYARGMLHWRRGHRFCGACGGGLDPRHGGHVLACRSCGKLVFPRIEPAVIMLVEVPGPPARCLLARHRGAEEGAYATLAGFVEIGECLEDAVRRELMEEAGVLVDSVAYQASQAWPFPSGLMVGFRAVASSDVVSVDEDELVDARWFTRDELRTHLAAGQGRRDSIESHLVDTWLAEG